MLKMDRFHKFGNHRSGFSGSGERFHSRPDNVQKGNICLSIVGSRETKASVAFSLSFDERERFKKNALRKVGNSDASSNAYVDFNIVSTGEPVALDNTNTK